MNKKRQEVYNTLPKYFPNMDMQTLYNIAYHIEKLSEKHNKSIEYICQRFGYLESIS